MDMESLHGYGNKQILDNMVHDYIVSADGNLNVGDLCEFINGQVKKTNYTAENSIVTQVGNVSSSYICSTIIDSTHVLVVYSGAGSYLYAVVLTINGVTINVGTLTQVTGTGSTYTSITLMDSTHALVTYMGANQYCYAVVLTINGSIINVGSLTPVNSASSQYTSVVKLDSTHAVVSYQGNATFLTAIVLTISGTTITAGTPTSLNSANVLYVSSVTLNFNQVFICWQQSGGYLCSVVITIYGTTITKGNIKTVNGVTCAYITSTLLDPTRVLVSYQNSSAGSFLWSVVLIITNSEITVGTLTQINSVSTSYITSITIDSTHVLLCYENNASGGLCNATILIINGITTTVGNTIQVNSLTTNYIFAILIDSFRVLVSYATGTTNSSVVIGIDLTKSPTLKVITHAKQPYIITITTANSGSIIKGYLKGIVKGLTGLIPNNTYYCDDGGNLTTTRTRIGEKAIGVALSNTDLLINEGFWER